MTIKERCDEVRELFYKKISLVENICDKSIKGSVYFSLIDCLAQEYTGYCCSKKSKNREAFKEFIEKFSCNKILHLINYVTLYYDNKEKFNEKGIFIDKILSQGCVYEYDQISRLFPIDQVNDIADINMNQHELISQLWFYRNKLLHECNAMAYDIAENGFLVTENVPYFYSISTDWVFCIPIGFLKNLLTECLNNYLIYCEKNNKDPFQNNCKERKFYLAWTN